MNSVRVLLIVLKKGEGTLLKKAYDVDKTKGISISGLGNAYLLDRATGLYCTTMQVKGDAAKLHSRIVKLRNRCFMLGRIGIVLPGDVERIVRELDNTHTLFYLSKLSYLRDLTPNAIHEEYLAAIYNEEAKKRLKKKKKKNIPKKRKMVELEEGGLLLSSAKVKLLMERDVGVTLAKEDDDDNACAVCFENVITHMAFPCTHYALCKVCAQESSSECPICRRPVDRYVTPIKK